MLKTESVTEILWNVFDSFRIPINGTRVAVPYRINDISNPHAVGPEFRGKSSPEVLKETTLRLAFEQGIDLEGAPVEFIRSFMRRNLLGIDCSGYVYRVLDELAQRVKGKPLTELGFEHVGRTNVRILTSPEHALVADPSDIKPADLIRMNSGGDILHVALVMDRRGDKVTYTHSSSQTKPDGVHSADLKIIGNNFVFEEELGDITFRLDDGDGVRRLRALQD